MAKKYYWLKLHENFFEREEVKVIEMQTNGEKYIIFYLKLLVKSISTEGRLMFRDVIPYTPDMLSKITNTDVDTVKVAIDLFAKLGLMDKLDNGALFMREVKNMIGSESKWAQYKRKDKEVVPELPFNEEGLENFQQESKDAPKKLQAERETEKELDIEKDKDIDIREREKKKNLSLSIKSNTEVFKFIEKCNITMSALTMEKIAEDIEIYSASEVVKAAEIANDRGKRSYAYIKGILETRRAEGTDTKSMEEKSHGANNDNRGEELRNQGIGL